MNRTFCAAVLVGGEADGIAVVSDTPLSLWGGLDPLTGEITDRHHPLSGANVAGQILVLPFGRGSCSASGVLLESSRNGFAPAGFVVLQPDPIIGLGAILSDELLGKPIPVIQLTRDDFERIATGNRIRIGLDGTVEVEQEA